MLLPLCTALRTTRTPPHGPTSEHAAFCIRQRRHLSRSVADYEAVCQAACDDDEAFSKFKAQEAYQDVLEHVSYDVGRCYEHRLKIDHPSLIEDQGIERSGHAISKTRLALHLRLQ